MKKVLMLLLILGLLGTASADFQDGLIAYWDFEGNSFQSQVAGSPTCLKGGDPQFVERKSGEAMHFDGSGDIVYMDFGTGEYVDTCDDGMTVMAWVKTDQATGWNGYVSRDGENGLGWQLRLRSSNNACFTTRDAGSSNNDGSPSSMEVNDGQWRLIAATFDPNDAKKLYINGVLDQTDVASAVIPGSLASLALGGRQRDNMALDGFSNVILDDVAVWDRALTAEELAALYNTANAGRSLDQANTWFPTLVGPVDGTIEVPQSGVLLEWAAPAETPPAAIAKYDVYLSRNEPNATMDQFIGSVNAGETLAFDSGTLLNDSTYYWMVDAVIDSSSKALSAAGSFKTIVKKPVFTVNPSSVSTWTGETVSFTCEAVSDDVPAYQWYKGGSAISGETSTTLTIAAAQDSDIADYYCVASNDSGSTQSASVSLAIKHMIGHWTFDETEGSIAHDTSPDDPVNDADAMFGTAAHPDPDSLWNPDGMIGGCIDLAGGGGGNGDWFDTGKLASALDLDGNTAKSVSVWVYPRAMNDGGIWDLGERSTGKNWCLRTESESHGDHGWRVQYWGGDSNFNTAEPWQTRGYSMPSLNAWIHFVLTHDGAYTRVYANGLLIVDWAKTIDTGNVISFRIGQYGADNEKFNGLIDDMRLYDTALTHTEVIELYSAVIPDDPICVDETNPAMDLNGDCRVGVEDLALFVSEWLECNLVPDCKP